MAEKLSPGSIEDIARHLRRSEDPAIVAVVWGVEDVIARLASECGVAAKVDSIDRVAGAAFIVLL